MTYSTRFTLVPRGRFDLAQSANFGFGQRDAVGSAESMSLAFCLDGYARQVAVEVRQGGAGPVTGEVVGALTEDDVARASAHVARVLSLDHDAAGYDALLAHDPLLGKLAEVRPGLRPPLFYSAYEAAAWAVLSARRPAKQMAVVRERLSREHGRVFSVAGREITAFPTPEQLAEVQSFPGIPAVKLDRLHGIAKAALAGALDTEALRELPPDEAGRRLRLLPGLGPFYSQLIIVRSLGHADVLADGEPRVLSVLGSLLGRPEPLSQRELSELADAWRPWRTWATVLVRAAGGSATSSENAQKRGRSYSSPSQRGGRGP
jgi:DNA-3-methyladenine glycosylase II